MKVIRTLVAFVAVIVAGYVMLESLERYGKRSSSDRELQAAPAGTAQEAPTPPDYAARLANYSGHGEWVRYAAEDGVEITGYIAFPERPDAAPAMIVIHEIFGMSDFVRSVTHDLAEAGFVALAPDLLSRVGGTEGADDARTAIRDLDPDGITTDLDATKAYLRSLDSVRGGSIGVMGFCWGGSQTFRYATNASDIGAAVVCYGGAPETGEMARITAPVLGVYAENDARINTALPEVEAAMEAAGKEFAYEIYEGADHGFIRSRNVPEEADRAWRNIISFLTRELGNDGGN